MSEAEFVTRSDLAEDLRRLGVGSGDVVMVHAALSTLGPMLGGPDSFIGAMADSVGPQGTILAYTDWDAGYEELAKADGTIPDRWRAHVPPFDPMRSRAIRDNGTFPEFLRTTPGAMRSASPGPSVAALGARAAFLTENHALDYGYGKASPFARLLDLGGKVLMAGAPLDTMTLIHHAEHLAQVEGKRIKRIEVPLATPQGTQWRMIEEFDTGQAMVAALDGRDYFTQIVEAYLDSGKGTRGRLGRGRGVLVDAPGIVGFAKAWLENECGKA